jgi:hypothetical protein
LNISILIFVNAETKTKITNVLQLGSSNWEAADLGNEERKQKFLRLMGAGKVSIGCFYLFKTGLCLYG